MVSEPGRSCQLRRCVLASWWLYVIYPFDFGSATANDLARFGLVLLIVAATIGMLVNTMVGIVQLARRVSGM